MKKTNKNKKQSKAKKTVKDTTGEQEVEENLTLMDTAISSKSSSSLVSSIYLFSLALIILGLAVIIGLVSYIHSYNFAEKSTERFGFRTGDYDERASFQEDNGIQESEDLLLDDVGQLYVGDTSETSQHEQNHDMIESSEKHEQNHDLNESSDKQKQNHVTGKSNQQHKQNVVSTPEQNKKDSNLEHRDLFHSYTFDFEKALKRRQEAMKKYSYPYSTEGVDKRSNLSLQEFYDVYDGKWPVIITDVIPTWPAINWSTKTLKAKYGEARVAMMTYNILGLPDFKGSKEGFSVPLGVFLDHLNVSSDSSWTYLQDEVFLVQFPELRAQVLDTIYTKEDFFNLFPREIRPWDCLILWGTAHSRSTLHIDPYNWTGTNAVISGRKRWKLLPPGQDKLLAVHEGAGCGFPLECQKYNSKYDTYSQSDQIKRKLKKLNYLEVDQLSGEMLFIPTGWFHQAYNVVPTLAVSGEIMNRNNYLAVLEEIFHVGNLPRSILPRDVEKLTPKELVEFVMSNMPAKIIAHGAEWTKENIKNLYKLNAGSLDEGKV